MPDFLDAHLISILNGLAIGMLLFTMAVGLSVVFGLMDVLNLAHGAIFLLGSFIALQLLHQRLGLALALLAVLAVGAGLGLLLSVSLAPLAGRGHLDQALLTLGLGFVLSEVTVLIWGREFESVPPPGFLQGSVDVLGHAYPQYRLGVIVVGVVTALIVFLAFERTQLGAIVRASVEDREMVSALGIDVTKVAVVVLSLGVALAAFGGVIGAPVLSIRPGLEWEVLILALIVVVVGGLGSIKGAFVGAIVIGEVQSLGVALVPQVASFALFGAMAVLLLLRPDGLFGDASARTAG